ncbi:sodium-translocating pyrophosphatase [Naumannella cuiyingiana]|uniref:K(+)-insensitive pyrophosphate-energized proton pump n=1 Tax=Naumannella cuiyingiana TaxID=1347891 RepID=A0A7Z0D9S4_9ACTN|nr:K(+)-stimulated pyrophosphate-energized sodium pump [Naumannella cuiyingiana]
MEPGIAVLEGANLTIVVVVAVIACIAIAMALVFRGQVLRAPDGTPGMRAIATAVQEGAAAYLARQFRTLGVFAVVAFVLLLALPAEAEDPGMQWVLRISRSAAFLVGGFASAMIGYLGMWLAVRANVRVAEAARTDKPADAMRVAFRTGACVGMATVGFGLLGAALVVLIFRGDAPIVLEGFGFGAALVAMFMRVGGGIFTKAADVGADLVGKVEQNIPEDDPRNAATIADNVGDNVGDCAGMAADLFESYAVTLVASLILGRAAFGSEGLVFPLIIPAIGVITALIGVFLTRPRQGVSGLTTINRAFYLSALVSAALTAIACWTYLPARFADLGVTEFAGPIDDPRVVAFGAVLIGILLAVVILALTGYYTGTDKRPVRDVGKTSLTGAATVVLSGISLGLSSAVYTALVIAAGVLGAFLLGGVGVTGLFTIALAGCGLLTTVGVIVAMDTFGPVSDNAQGIAEMSGEVDGAGAQTLTDLDAVGNTTKAITKGIAIATAVLAATALFGSYTDSIGKVLGDRYAAFVESAAVYVPSTLVGIIVGASVVFLFSGLAISAVGRAAGAVVMEVRRQFREIPGIMEGTGKPEYGRVVDIVTRDSLRELATPGLLAIFAPIAVGFGLGAPALAGYLAGTIACGTLMAVFLANSGGAWDNAKKLVEDGYHGGKGSPAHEATVIGDTVGDPFKDTAGPAINPLIKVMNLVALLIAPAVVGLSALAGQDNPIRYAIALAALAVIIVAVVISSRRDIAIADDSDQGSPPVGPGGGAGEGAVAEVDVVEVDVEIDYETPARRLD